MKAKIKQEWIFPCIQYYQIIVNIGPIIVPYYIGSIHCIILHWDISFYLYCIGSMNCTLLNWAKSLYLIISGQFIDQTHWGFLFCVCQVVCRALFFCCRVRACSSCRCATCWLFWGCCRVVYGSCSCLLNQTYQTENMEKYYISAVTCIKTSCK